MPMISYKGRPFKRDAQGTDIVIEYIHVDVYVGVY